MRNTSINEKFTSKGAKMKHKTLKTYIILIAVISALVIPSTVLAKGNVTYKGEADKIVFEPGSASSPTNLFPEFEKVMPGDSLTETIEVKNDSAEGDEIKIYMRALGADSGSEDFLSQLELTVDANDSKLFDAKASEKTGLDDWTLLGTLAKGGTASLDVKLGVPITLGNDYQDKVGTLKWQFKVETVDQENDDNNDDDNNDNDNTNDEGDGSTDNDGGTTDDTDKDSKTKSVSKKNLSSTGDTAAITGALVILALAAVVLVATFRKRQKH